MNTLEIETGRLKCPPNVAAKHSIVAVKIVECPLMFFFQF
jgi:hypothetical protein